MTYEIKIERLDDDPGKDYPKKVEIYSQRVDDLDVEAVIRAVNKIERDQDVIRSSHIREADKKRG